MANFQLKTVAAFLGIEVDESRLHDAEYDIDLTMQIYDIVTK
jgi:DNA polymerase-3 subunit epsilon